MTRPPPVPPVPPGLVDLPERVGRYAIGNLLGVGGFAQVVRARDESLDADVALKILSARFALDADIRERFVREARLLRRVRNPSVVTVHDVGETGDGRPFLVMDIAEGGVLQDRLGPSDVPPDGPTLAAVVTTLAEGLGALHAAGVIHRDVKPANLLILSDAGHPSGGGAGGARRLLEPGERLVIGDLGLAKDQLATAWGPTMVGGTPGFQAPEQLEVGARIDARTDVYAATAVLWVLLTGQAAPRPQELAVKLLAVSPAWQAVLGRGLSEEPDSRFGSMAEWAEAACAAIASGEGDTGGAATRPVLAAATFPYKGLAAFQAEDAPLFFGRSELVDQLVARLQQRAALVVGGPSGSGKSSLLRAGLLPALAGGALPGSQRWPVCLFTPAEHPLTALGSQLAALGGVAEAPDTETLRADPARALDAVTGTTVVAVDQFEELFTLCGDPGEREAFLAVLAALTGGARPPVRLVLAVRADFYGTCAAHPWIAAAINDNQVLVGPMSRAQLRQAVEGPARRVGLHLEEGLVDRVLTDAGDDAGALPLVAHVLVETWLRREGTRLTVAGYEAAGGVTGAIGRSADDVWERLDGDNQRVARRLLLRLVHPGDGMPDTKRLLTWDEVGDDPATRLVLSRFADSRLLSVDERGVQLAHEALLRTWASLAAWVDESRDELRAAERIEDAAQEWRRQGGHADLLFRGFPLAAALEWRAHHEGAIGEPAASFLAAAETARDAERRAGEAQAERSRRTRRRAVAALATLTVLALLSSLLAGVALGRSRRDTRSARRAGRRVSEQLARGLAASAVEMRMANPYLATVSAAEAIARVSPPLAEARNALVLSRLALAGSRLVPYGDPLAVGDALSVAVNRGGDRAATGNRDGTVLIWDLGTRRQVSRLTGPTGGVQDLAFTADGRWLVAASVDHRVWRWGVGGDTGGAGTVLTDTGSIVWSVAAAPAGTTVAAATEAGEVVLLDAATGATAGEGMRPDAGELLSVRFAPDGSTLLAGSGRGQVLAWSLPSRQPRFPPLAAHTSDVWEIVMSDGPGPGRFVTVSSDGTAKLWDLSTGASIGGGPFDGESAGVPRGVRGVTLGPDGDTLTLGGADGALYAWSLSGHKLLQRSGPAQRDRVTAAARSADGLVLATLSDDRTVQLWSERARPGPVTDLARVDAQPSSIAVGPDAATLAVGADDGTVRILDALTGREARRLGGHVGAVGAVAFDGPERLVSGDSAGTLRVWDLAQGRLRAERRGAHAGAISALSAGAGGLVASGGTDATVRLWSAAGLTVRSKVLRTPAPVTDVATSAGSVAASTERGEVARWTTGGRPIGKVFRVADDTVWAIALSDGSGSGETRLAAAGADEVLSLWSLGRGAPHRTRELGSHRGGALDVSFLDPATVVVTSADGSVHLWDAAAGAAIGPPLPVAQSPIRHVATAADGTLWTAARDGTIARVDALVVRAACAAAAATGSAGVADAPPAGRAGRRPCGSGR